MKAIVTTLFFILTISNAYSAKSCINTIQLCNKQLEGMSRAVELNPDSDNLKNILEERKIRCDVKIADACR